MNDQKMPSAAVATRTVGIGAPLLDLRDAKEFATTLAMASVLPEALRNKPADVLAMVLYGQDLGLSPMQSIQGIYVVKGKPQISAQTWIALARNRGHNPFVACRHCDKPPEQHPQDGAASGDKHRYIPDHDATRCRFTVIRGDTGARHTELFTIEDAQRAKLAGKDVWVQYPKRMLLARAASDCCRVICPEIALGFYAEGDEFTDDNAATSAVAGDIEPPIEMQEETPPEQVEQQIADMADTFDFSAKPKSDGGAVDAEVVPDEAEEPFPEYRCEICSSDDHFEDECPQSTAAPR